jgi:hypothetical protein
MNGTACGTGEGDTLTFHSADSETRDGTLDMNEFAMFMARFGLTDAGTNGTAARDEIAALVRSIDTNKDRSISLDEFIPVMGRFQEIGSFTVTNTAHVDMTYVLPPGTPAAIEVTGEDLADTLGRSASRIMIVDLESECGVDESARSVLEMGPEDWHWWSPADNAAHIAESTGSAEPVAELTWRSTEGYFCPGNNLDLNLTELTLEHQCHRKCKKGCTGDDCFCNGWYDCTGAGCDEPSSKALCADVNLCKHIASRLFGVVGSIDMHEQLPRCFLNVKARQECTHEGFDPSYLIDNSLYTMHTAVAPKVVVIDSAYSSRPDILRFYPLHFRTPGTFKACFCDGSLHTCDTRAAYGVTLGEVHVSGVECLLSAGKHRGECAQQTNGGMRCYDGAAPLPALHALPEVVEPRNFTTDFCAFGPPEETLRDPRCRPKGPHPTPAPTPEPTPEWLGPDGGDEMLDELADGVFN